MTASVLTFLEFVSHSETNRVLYSISQTLSPASCPAACCCCFSHAYFLSSGPWEREQEAKCLQDTDLSQTAPRRRFGSNVPALSPTNIQHLQKFSVQSHQTPLFFRAANRDTHSQGTSAGQHIVFHPENRAHDK